MLSSQLTSQPTSGAITLENVIPISPTFDTLGVLARDPHQWTNILRHWYVRLHLFDLNQANLQV